MQIFQKLKDFLFSRLGKNQPLQIQELDPNEPDLPAEDVPFDLGETEVREVYTDCDCDCGNDSCKNSKSEVLHNGSIQDAIQKEETPGIAQTAPAEVTEPVSSAEIAPVVEEPKKTEKKPKGRPKNKSAEGAKEKLEEKKTGSKPKKNYYKKKKKSKGSE